jgi:hypothetical protein
MLPPSLEMRVGGGFIILHFISSTTTSHCPLPRSKHETEGADDRPAPPMLPPLLEMRVGRGLNHNPSFYPNHHHLALPPPSLEARDGGGCFLHFIFFYHPPHPSLARNAKWIYLYFILFYSFFFTDIYIYNLKSSTVLCSSD